MKICRIVLSLLCSAVIVSAALQVGWAQPPLPSLPPVDAGDDDVEVYTRGALHEAFAIPVSNDVVVPPVVQKEPPAIIEELPPEQQPEGENVTWIAGYWAFDEDLDDYIWISGLWRDVPPGRQWVPGYWAQTPDGYQWVSGMWTEVGASTISYLPTPPDTLEQGPQIQSPGSDYFYVPGCWEFHDGRYVWRSGYWAPRQREWIWVPAHYVYTPYGCCFVAGHWDLLLIDRGLCYAPVRFVHRRPAVVYRPVIVIDTWDSMVMHLWVDPRRGCYTYGNYYEARHSHFVPWYEYRGHGGGHDHLFAYYEWRNGPQYRQRLSGWHNHFVSNRDWRPPATYREQVRFVEQRRSNTNVNINLNLAIDVRKIDRDRDDDHHVHLPVALKQVSRDDDTRYREQAKSWVTASQSRKQVETRVARIPEDKLPDRNDRPREAKQVTLELPKAVAVAKRDVPKLETPDKLKDVKPDKPRGEDVRIPSRTREQRVAQEETLKRNRPDPKRADVETPTDVPPPPPGRDAGEQASKEDKDKKKPDVRDAFGIDSPGRDKMPDRPGRAQTDPNKPGADAKTTDAPPTKKGEGRDNDPQPKTPKPTIGRPGDDNVKPDRTPSRDANKAERDVERPDMRRRNEVPNTDTDKPIPKLPNRTPSNDPTPPRTNRLPSTTDRTPNLNPRTDRDRSLPPEPSPRQSDDTKTIDRRPGVVTPPGSRSNVPRLPDSLPGGTNRSPGTDPPRDRVRSDDRTPNRTDGDKGPPRASAIDSAPRRPETTTPKSSAPPEKDRRDSSRPSMSNRPSERQPEPNRAGSSNRSPEPSVDRKQDSPRAGNQPPKSSSTDPIRRSEKPGISPKTSDPKNDRSKATTPERKPAPRSDSKEKDKDKKDEKDKEKKPA